MFFFLEGEIDGTADVVDDERGFAEALVDGQKVALTVMGDEGRVSLVHSGFHEDAYAGLGSGGGYAVSQQLFHPRGDLFVACHVAGQVLVVEVRAVDVGVDVVTGGKIKLVK